MLPTSPITANVIVAGSGTAARFATSSELPLPGAVTSRAEPSHIATCTPPLW